MRLRAAKFIFKKSRVMTHLKISENKTELEDLKVLRRSPDLLNNVKIGQLQLIMEQILFYHIWGLQPFWSMT